MLSSGLEFQNAASLSSFTPWNTFISQWFTPESRAGDVACVRAAESRYVLVPRDNYSFLLISDVASMHIRMRLLTMHSATRSDQHVAIARSRLEHVPVIPTTSIWSFEMKTKLWPRRQGNPLERQHQATAPARQVPTLLRICMYYAILSIPSRCIPLTDTDKLCRAMGTLVVVYGLWVFACDRPKPQIHIALVNLY